MKDGHLTFSKIGGINRTLHWIHMSFGICIEDRVVASLQFKYAHVEQAECMRKRNIQTA